MSISAWLAFMAASAIVLIIPGPTVLAVVGYSAAYGRRANIPLIAAVALGDSSAFSLSLLGLGALLSTSAAVFSFLKIAGGAYLLLLGIRLVRSGMAQARPPLPVETKSRWLLFANTYIVTALNPKSIMFFLAFVPHFISASEKTGTSMVILAFTFVMMATLNATMYVCCANSARRVFDTPRARRRFNIAGGSLLSGAGIWALLARTPR